jgi:hypothetical protein
MVAELVVTLQVQLVVNNVASLQITEHTEVFLSQLQSHHWNSFADFRKVFNLVLIRLQNQSNLFNKLS